MAGRFFGTVQVGSISFSTGSPIPNQAAYILKLDQSRHVAKATVIRFGSSLTSIYGLQAARDGRLLLTLGTNQSIDFGTSVFDAGSTPTVVVAEFDSQLTFLALHAFPRLDTNARPPAETADGGFLLVGTFLDSPNFGCGELDAGVPPLQAAFLGRLDRNLDCKNSQVVAVGNTARALWVSDVTMLPNGSAVVAGATLGSVFVKGTLVSGPSSSSSYDGIAFSLDQENQLTWLQQFAGRPGTALSVNPGPLFTAYDALRNRVGLGFSTMRGGVQFVPNGPAASCSGGAGSNSTQLALATVAADNAQPDFLACWGSSTAMSTAYARRLITNPSGGFVLLNDATADVRIGGLQAGPDGGSATTFPFLNWLTP